MPPGTEIIVSKNDEEVLRVTVKPGEYVIGRDSDCDVVVDEEDLSRRHSLLTVNFDHALIEDLGSSNGTFVNETPITKITRLWPNQKIRLGTSTIISVHRLKTDTNSGMSLAPTQEVIKRISRRAVAGEKIRHRRHRCTGRHGSHPECQGIRYGTQSGDEGHA